MSYLRYREKFGFRAAALRRYRPLSNQGPFPKIRNPTEEQGYAIGSRNGRYFDPRCGEGDAGAGYGAASSGLAMPMLPRRLCSKRERVPLRSGRAAFYGLHKVRNDRPVQRPIVQAHAGWWFLAGDRPNLGPRPRSVRLI
jgi:hypothetical protein